MADPCREQESDYDSGVQDYASAYDPSSKKCYPTSRPSQGPCKKNMKFYQRPDNPNYGFCDCDKDRPAVYNQDTDACHLLFHRVYSKLHKVF